LFHRLDGSSIEQLAATIADGDFGDSSVVAHRHHQRHRSLLPGRHRRWGIDRINPL
jgi:hypothetical protein